MPLPPEHASAREVMRANHQSAVFDAIHRNGPISRVELAAQLRLSAAAITDITAELIQRHLIFEAREAESSGVGRRKILLEVDYRQARVVGVKVSNAAIYAVLTDLKGEVVDTAESALPDTRVDTVLDLLAARIQALSLGSATAIAGVGVSLPGAVDHERGIVTFSPLLDWQEVPLATALGDRVGLPVVVENDVNAFAAAEAWFGRGHEARDFLVVTLGRGVGLGIVIGGELYRGPQGGAGELGHVVLDPSGPAGLHSGPGTVESLISDSALAERARARVPGFPADGSVETLVERASAGDRDAQVLLEEAGAWLGRTLAMLANVFAPSLVVLAGEGMRAERYLLPAARGTLDAFAFGGRGGRLELVVEPWGDDAWARGAATLAASRYLARQAARLGGERTPRT